MRPPQRPCYADFTLFVRTLYVTQPLSLVSAPAHLWTSIGSEFFRSDDIPRVVAPSAE